MLAAIVFLPRYGVLNLSPAGRTVVAAVFLLTRRSHTGTTIAVSTAVKVLSIAASGIYLTVYPYVLAGPGLPAGAGLGIEVATQLMRYFRRPASAA